MSVALTHPKSLQMSEVSTNSRDEMIYWMTQSYALARREGREGIEQWQKRMHERIFSDYHARGARRDTGPRGFARYVLERDASLGIESGVSDVEIVENKDHLRVSFRYWLVDPFLVLRKSDDEKVDPEDPQIPDNEYREISTNGYLAGSVRYFCNQFKPTMVRNMWNGNHDPRTEWELVRIIPKPKA